MVESSGSMALRFVAGILASFANATLLLILTCLFVGTWGALKIEDAAERTLLRAETTLASTLAPQTERVVGGLHRVENEIKNLGAELEKLSLAVDRSPEIELPSGFVKEVKSLVNAIQRLSAEAFSIKAGDFHLPNETWKHIAVIAVGSITAGNNCHAQKPQNNREGG